MSDREPGFESDPFPEAQASEPEPSPPAAPVAPPPGAAALPSETAAAVPPPSAAAAPPASPLPGGPPVTPPLSPSTPPPPPAYAAYPPGPTAAPAGWPAGYGAPPSSAPPAYGVPPPGSPYPYPLLPEPARVGYAGFWIRVLAWLIDAILLWILSLGTHTIIRLSAGMPVFPLWTWRGAPGPPALNCAEALVGLAVGWLYGALFESSASQATLGKQALRLRVTDMTGRRISFARATGRHFAKFVSAIILGIGFLMVAFTGRRQGLHDMMAETVVLRDRR